MKAVIYHADTFLADKFPKGTYKNITLGLKENLNSFNCLTVKQMIALYKKVNNCEFDVNVCQRRAGDLEKSVLDYPSSYMTQMYSIDKILKVKN